MAFAVTLTVTVALLAALANAEDSPTFQSLRFSQGYDAFWGRDHQQLSADESTVTIWLDSTTGSGFKSRQAYTQGYFSAAIKLPAGYTAGIVTAFYLSNSEDYPGHHDEIDMEFVGRLPGEPYTLQTNVYVNGSGDVTPLQGREHRFHLSWFEPSDGVHNYSVLWTHDYVVFYVDGVAVRKYPRRVTAAFPASGGRAMRVYASIWDASSATWATDNGTHPANYAYAPFAATFSHLVLAGCPAGSPDSACSPEFEQFVAARPNGGLTGQERQNMRQIRSQFLIYNYCKDHQRYPQRLPECGRHHASDQTYSTTTPPSFT